MWFLGSRCGGRLVEGPWRQQMWASWGGGVLRAVHALCARCAQSLHRTIPKLHSSAESSNNEPCCPFR